VTVEFQMTRQGFNESKELIFRANGWEPNSVQAQMYERRLNQPEATGWFGLSNVFGSYMACFVAFWLSITLGAARSRMSSGWVGLLGIVTTAAMAGLAVSFSKGAIASGVVGVFLAMCVLLPRRHRRRVIPWTIRISVGLVVVAIFAVVLRSALLGESFDGDGYSLLFRWYYWEGAFRAFVNHPIFGVGAEGFKSAYLIFKPVLSPEEVSSPHNVFVSYLSTLGLFGVFWVAFWWIMMYRASPSFHGARVSSLVGDEVVTSSTVANASTGSRGREDADEPSMRESLILSAIVGILALGGGWWINRGTFYPDFAFLLWPLAIAGYVGLMAVLPRVSRHTSWFLMRWSVWSGLTILLLHNQIEMTLTRPSAAAALFVLLGAGALSSIRVIGKVDTEKWIAKRGGPVFSFSCVVAVVVMSGVHVLWATRPIVSEQSSLRKASIRLSSAGRMKQQVNGLLQSRDPNAFLENVRQVSESLKERGIDVRVEGRIREMQSALRLNDRARVGQVQRMMVVDIQYGVKKLELEVITGSPSAQRGEAADGGEGGAMAHLEAARLTMPYDPIPWEQQAKLWLVLARAHDESGDVQRRDQAYDVASRLMETIADLRPDLARLPALAASLFEERWKIDGNADALAKAVSNLHRAIRIDPNNMQLALRIARLTERTTGIEAAEVWYRKVLEINQNQRLDLLRQLPEVEREEIEKRIANASDG